MTEFKLEKKARRKCLICGSYVSDKIDKCTTCQKVLKFYQINQFPLPKPTLI